MFRKLPDVMLPFTVVSPSANQSSVIPAFWNFPSLSRFGYQVSRAFAPPTAMSFAPSPLKSPTATVEIESVRDWSTMTFVAPPLWVCQLPSFL